jgi:hypothetical protein
MALDTRAATEVRHFQNYIGGEWVDAASGETFDVTNPATEEVFATVPKGDREDARSAIEAARLAYDSGEWSGMDPEERKRILLSVVEKFSELEDELSTGVDAGRDDDPRHEHGGRRLLHQPLGLLRQPGDAADAGGARARQLPDALVQLRAA